MIQNVQEQRVHFQEFSSGREAAEVDGLLLHDLHSDLCTESVHPVLHNVPQAYLNCNAGNYWETNYPVEDSGKVCNYDL